MTLTLRFRRLVREVDLYRQELAFCDLLLDRAMTAGIELRDRLDAQSVTWCVVTYDPGSDWPPEEQAAFTRWRAAVPTGEGEDELPDAPLIDPEPPQPDVLAVVANDLLLNPGAGARDRTLA